jgi:hypothetical protein
MRSTNLAEPQMAPFLAAIQNSDRARFGFTPLPPGSPALLEENTVASRGYDVMLHLSWSHRSETIGFVKVGSSYKWVCDQEIHEGPLEYDSPDGRFHEAITINYSAPDETADIRREHGNPPGFMVMYRGPNENLRAATVQNLVAGGVSVAAAERQLKVVVPVITEWQRARK